MTEAELLAHVLDAAAELGVLAYHSRDARRDLGNPGFPDVALVGERFELWELKAAGRYQDEDQREWAARLCGAGVAVRVVRPDMWPAEVYARLRAIRGR